MGERRWSFLFTFLSVNTLYINLIISHYILGFDPFMNLVLEEAVEEVSETERTDMGMVVSVFFCILIDILTCDSR